MPEFLVIDVVHIACPRFVIASVDASHSATAAFVSVVVVFAAADNIVVMVVLCSGWY